jgi:hypothetical protein
MPEPETDIFDFQIVMSDEEIKRHKRLALNLSGVARQYLNALDEMTSRKKKHERKKELANTRV